MSNFDQPALEIRAKGVIRKVLCNQGESVLFIWDSVSDVPELVRVLSPTPTALIQAGEACSIYGYIEDTDWGEQLLASDYRRRQPDSETFVAYVARNQRYVGLNQKRAEILWHTYGKGIFSLLDSRDAESIIAGTKIPRRVVQNLCEQWVESRIQAEVHQWLHDHQLPSRLAPKICAYYGSDATQRMNDNPYRLLALLSWIEVDAVAEAQGVSKNDPTRLVAAVVSVMYENWNMGHTAITEERLSFKLRSETRLGSSCHPTAAIKLAIDHREVVQLKCGLYQHIGANALERVVMDSVLTRTSQQGVTNKCEPGKLHAFEAQKSKIIGLPFKLSNEQEQAVELILSQSFACIDCGVGVGKTTVIEAVLHQIHDPELLILCGFTFPTSKRLSELIRCSTVTIGSLIEKATQGKVQNGSIIIVDDASLLDVSYFVRLVRSLPVHVSLILIGDSYQLPPNGPGLIFHLAVRSDQIKVVELKKPCNGSANTDLQRVAWAIKNLQAPHLDDFHGLSVKDNGLSLLQTNGDRALLEGVLRCYRELTERGEVQILTQTKEFCHTINSALHEEHTELLKIDGNECLVRAAPGMSIAQGEPVIWEGKNDYDRRRLHGSTGTILEIYEVSNILIDKNGEEKTIVAKAEFSGLGVVELSDSDLQNIALAYAVPLQDITEPLWELAVVAIEPSQVIDNRWLYTSIARTTKRAVVVGSKSRLLKAVLSAPTDCHRTVGIAL